MKRRCSGTEPWGTPVEMVGGVKSGKRNKFGNQSTPMWVQSWWRLSDEHFWSRARVVWVLIPPMKFVPGLASVPDVIQRIPAGL